MSGVTRTPGGDALTELVLDLFRVSSRMTTAGDRLVAGLGLTSARWQILGSMIAAGRPQPVSWLARDMGASRQNLQRIIYELEKDGLVALKPNPHHRRAPLVELTAAGHAAFDAAMALQAPWVDGLADGLSADEIATARKVVATLGERLDPPAD
jgi:DNA-binding MarR family transcriptional regulator